MARDDLIERSTQRLPIEIACQTQAARDVIGFACSLELGQEPQTLLRK